MTKTRKTKRVNSFPKLLFWSDTTILLGWIIVINKIIFVRSIFGTNLNLFVSGMMMKKVGISHVFVTDKVGERKQQLIYPSTLRRLHFYFVRMLLALSLSLSLSQTHTLSHANVLYYFSPTYFLEKCLVNEVKRNQKCCTVTFFSILQL